MNWVAAFMLSYVLIVVCLINLATPSYDPIYFDPTPIAKQNLGTR